MTQIEIDGPVLVTGGSGFVGGQLVEQLLAAGEHVRTTVRDRNAAPKLQHLRQLQQLHPGRLELFEADLLREGSFDQAVAGCKVVHHVASPFLLPEKIHDGQKQVVAPAIEGTRNVLRSVNAAKSVRRVVLTSSVGAVFGDYSDVGQMPGQVLSEEIFNSSSTAENNPYHFAKVAAEREAWRMCGAQSRWSLVTILPGMIFGPSPSAVSDSGSLFLLDELLRGLFFYGVPDFSFTTVDVREVALAHIRAAERPKAHGRYILAQETMTSFVEISRILRAVHARPYLLPRHQLPDFMVRLVGPLFGLDQRYIRNHLGIRFRVDNARSRSGLGIAYRPVEQTLRDHFASWLAQRGAGARTHVGSPAGQPAP